MAASVTPNCLSAMASSAPSSSSTDYVVQVLDLKPSGDRYQFTANDGFTKMKAILSKDISELGSSGKLQNLGLLRIVEYTCNSMGNGIKALVILKGEVAGPPLDAELKMSETARNPAILLQPKVDKKLVMSAAQIIQEHRGNAVPAVRMGISRRVYPLVSLTPYQGNWTIKVRVTSKGPMRSFKNARGEGNLFNVELTDEDGTQIRATMFKEAADKFYPKLELGKVYFISKGSLRVANKQYSTLKNDYEMTLNVNAEVEEVIGEGTMIPELSVHPIKIDELGPYVNGRELVDVIGVVQSVTGILTIRRKLNNEEVPKRDITIADHSNKTVVVSLWNKLATEEGETLLQMVKESPVVLVKANRASDYQGVSLSTTQNSVVLINPDLPEAHKLRSWFNKEGKEAHLSSAGASLLGGVSRTGSRSIYAERECISEMTQPSVGEDKPVYFNIRACVSFIKHEQAMWYQACQGCNRKVTEAGGSQYWCESCQKQHESCNLRYLMSARIIDFSGEAWISAFNEQTEQLLGHSADELSKIRNQDDDTKSYQAALKKAAWVPYIFRVSVAQSEYMNEKRQRITVRGLSPLDWVGESKFLLEEITKMRTS